MQIASAIPRRTRARSELGCVPAKHERITISVVQPDDEQRESLTWLLEKDGYAVTAFPTAQDMLRDFESRLLGCLIFDLQLPDMSGLELLARLRRDGRRQPFLVVADQCGAAKAVDLVRAGAVDVLEKPWGEKRLLASVAQACLGHQRWNLVQTRLDRLSHREREILELVIAGLPTKQIARRLGISPRTVDVHRSNIAKKLEAPSFAALVQTITRHELAAI